MGEGMERSKGVWGEGEKGEGGEMSYISAPSQSLYPYTARTAKETT